MKSCVSSRREPGRLTPGARLGIAAAAIGVVWLLVLPRVAALPPIQAHIQRNEAAGIDPAAKFYSELPAMPRLLEQVRRARAAEVYAPANQN